MGQTRWRQVAGTADHERGAGTPRADVDSVKILIPLDGSRLGDAVVSHVTSLVQRGPESHAEARSHQAAMERLLVEQGFVVRRFLVQSEPVAAILAHAVKERVDLVAMATHGRSGPGRWARGSVAEGVLREGPHSVLLVNPRGLALAGDDLRYHRLLLPIDGSTLVEDVAPTIGALAAAAGATVRLFGMSPAAERLVEVGRQALAARGVVVEVEVAPGPSTDPATDILRESDQRGVDLLVLYTGPRSSPARWPVERATEEVTRRAPCAVLLLRTSGAAAWAPSGR